MLWPLVVTLLGLGAAFAPVYLLLPDPPTIVPVALTALGAAWGIASWLRGKDRRGKRAGIAVVGVLACGFVSSYFFLVAAYDRPERAPAVGAPAPSIQAVRVRDRVPFHLEAQRGNGVLLVFFRGAW